MNIIAFDTSSNLLCAALIRGTRKSADEGMICEITIQGGLRHAELLINTIETLCKSAGIDRSELNGVVCGRGPGSFSGLRIGMATAKGIAEALNCPLASVSALDAIARSNKHWPGLVVPIIDARKKRVYAGIYEAGMRKGELLDISPEDLIAEIEKLTEHDPRPVLWSGPDLELLAMRQTRFIQVMNPLPRKGWGLELAQIGAERIEAGNWDTPSSGPEYIRASDAELGIIARAALAKQAESAS